MANRIEVLVDVVTDKAHSSLKSFKQSISDADGAAGKLKAGWAGATKLMQENAGQLAVIGGAALAAFAVKALAAFEDTAKAAIDLGAAVGLTTEEASRWIAVGDDMKVTGEDLTKSFGQVIKGLNKDAWAEYGVATHDAGGQIRSTNDIMLDAFDALSKIPAGAERAKAGNDLFGRSYKDLAPLIGKSREEYEKMLGAVEDGQVITEEEAKKAERMRLAQDALSDALQEVTLRVGEQVAELTPLVVTLVKILDLIDKVGAVNPFRGGDLGKSVDVLDQITKAAVESGDAIAYLTERGYGARAVEMIARYNDQLAEQKTKTDAAAAASAAATSALTEGAIATARGGDVAETASTAWWEAAAGLDAVAVAAEEASVVQDRFNAALRASQGVLGDAKDGYQKAETAQDELGQAVDDTSAAVAKQEQAHKDLVTQLNEHIDALTELRNKQLEGISAERDYEVAVDAAADAVAELDAKMKEEKVSLEEIDDASRDAANAAITSAEAFSTMGGNVKGSKGDIDAQIESLHTQASVLADGSPLKTRILDYIAKLQSIPTSVPTTITAVTDFAQAFADMDLLRSAARAGANVPVTYTSPKLPVHRSGTTNAEDAFIAHEGELVTGREGATVFTKEQTASMLGGRAAGNTYVTIHTGADPNQVIQIVKKAMRPGGPLTS